MQVALQEAGERAAWVVAGARAGAGGALLVVGEPGSGKSSLLAAAVQRAGSAAVHRTVGVPVEQGLPHGALHAVLRPLVDWLPQLPAVQQDALRVVLGLRVGPAPTPFLVGAAVLSLLAARAEDAPVVVVVDDAQWVDEASLHALAFAARRLAGERVGVLLAARANEVPAALDGVERCELAGITAAEAVRLVDGLAPEVAPVLVQLSQGNLLALVERAAALSDDQRAGRAPLPDAGQDRPVFVDRAAALPVSAQRAAALAALLEQAPAALLLAAWDAARLGPAALVPAEEAGLLVSGADGVRWRHPLARSAVLDAVGPQQQRALAAVAATAAQELGADEALVVDLRLAAADAPDEQLALGVERAAAASDTAADHDRAARLWERAASVGTDPARRATRLFEAAESTLRAGHLVAAQALYEQALAAGIGPAEQARAHLARGRIEHTAGSPWRALEAFRAAADCAPTAALLVRACAEGVLAAMYAVAPQEAAALALRAEEQHDPGSAGERLLVLHARGVAATLGGDRDTALPLLLAAVQTAEDSGVLAEQPDLVLWVITPSLFLADPQPDLGLAVAAPALDALRLRGGLTWLPRVVRLWGVRHELAGRWLAAYATYEEAVELSRAAGQTTQLVEALSNLASCEAFRGDREACLAHADETDRLLARLDVPFLAPGWWHRGLLHLTVGEPAAAAQALAPAAGLGTAVPWRADVVADLVEALVLDGRPEQARAAADTAPSERAAGVLAADDDEAVRLLLAAASPDDPLTAARCRLLAGERLRRAGRRLEARELLREAAETFGRAGAQPWAQRAQEALRASGQTLLAPEEGRETLTGAELRVAALVAEGRPTREVAALLFLSPKTVEFHLSRIYRKLGVRGRAELARRLASVPS